MANLRPLPKVREFDLARDSLRDLNFFLHKQAVAEGFSHVRVINPDGAHSVACGLDAHVDVQIHGHVGYYAAGMNQHASVTVHGNAGPGAAENMMSGRVHVKGFASTAAGASAHGGLLIVDGDASLRCGISLKGADIVVGGSVGSFSAFMAQAGRIVICGTPRTHSAIRCTRRSSMCGAKSARSAPTRASSPWPIPIGRR